MSQQMLKNGNIKSWVGKNSTKYLQKCSWYREMVVCYFCGHEIRNNKSCIHLLVVNSDSGWWTSNDISKKYISERKKNEENTGKPKLRWLSPLGYSKSGLIRQATF